MKLLFPCAFAVIASAQPLILSNNFASKPFAGIGGISGGGATSRSLFDYPESARSTLLNLLFSSQYGASFGHAKVEIPANADTTCGSEVAHRHDADDGGSCDRGYEGWFLQQATQRGVEITSSLQWAAPLFVGEEGVNGGKSLFTLTNIDQFVIPWLKCMKSAYNISLKFQGAGWNEHPHNNSYIKLMRSQLDSAGLSDIGLAASDECCGSNWNIAIDMASDPQLAAAVDVITTHVAGSLEENTPTPIEALTSGKPLSQGEEHIGMPDPDGVPIWEWAAAASVGIEINQNWVVNSMTSTVYWPAAYAWPSGLLYRGKGFIVATSPWGNSPWFVPAALFVVSHTTHFTAPDGTWFLTNQTGSGHIGDGKVRPIPTAPGGWNISYVSYVKKDDPACQAPTLMCPFTLVVESFFEGGVWHSSHNRSTGALSTTLQTFSLADGLQNWIGKSLYVWHSNISTQFVQEKPIIVAADGTFTVDIEPSSIWTITTVYSAHPGGPAFIESLSALGGAYLDPLSVDPNGPQDAPFPIPFSDDFEGYNNDTLPLFSADMFGAFTVYSTSGGPPPIRYHHPDESIRASVPCSTLEHAVERPSRCIIPPSSIESQANTKTLRQWVRQPPIGWGGDSSNMATIYGNSTLVDIRVNISVMIETIQSGYEPSQAPYVLVGIHGGPGLKPADGGGASPRSFYQTGPDLDFVWLSAAGQWGCSITGLTESFCATSHSLPSSFGFDTWHDISIGADVQPNGDAFFLITFDGLPLANATVPLDKRKNGGSGGYVALVSGSTRVQWDNLLINRA
jgi:hypothetical protein